MTKVLLVGCGKMGGAMLAGWLDRGLIAADVVVVEPHGAGVPAGIVVVADAARIPAGFAPDVVVLATKPQVMPDVVPAYARFGSAVFLSIAAGRTLAFFAGLLRDVAIVRAMPNTPAAVGRGITVCTANPKVNGNQRALCQDLLEAVGEVAWVEDEGLIDAVTAVSGSGPAYVFLLAEAMEAAGAKAGLPPELAARLARATVSGAGELLRQSTESPDQLRKNVTSPGGTTAAALAVLMAEGAGMENLLTRAIQAATDRSRELAG